jgi:hypothetical protein
VSPFLTVPSFLLSTRRYVAAAEAEEVQARAAAESAVRRLADLRSAAKAIWSPPPLPANPFTGEKAKRVWEAHDGE